MFLALVCVVLGVAPGVLFGPLVGLAPWSRATGIHVGLHVPGTGSLPTLGIALVLVSATVVLLLLRGSRRAAPAPTWACGQLVEPALRWTSAGFTKPLRLVLEVVLRPEREITSRADGGVLQEVAYTGHVPHLIEERVYRPIGRASRPRRSACAPAADRKRRHLCRVSDCARRRPARGRAAGVDRVSARALVSAAVQIIGGDRAAPLLLGLIQHWKARLQGRRGPTPLQPYRELRRLWGKSAVDPEGSGPIYRIAPAVAAAALVGTVLVVPVAGAAPTLGLGHDALVLLGLLALARFARRSSRVGCRERLLADGRKP